MIRIKIKTVLFLTLLEIFLVATTAFEETCEFDREMEKKCRIHNYKTVKPLLDYFRQVRNELEDKEIKENKLIELNSDLMEKYHKIVEIHEKFTKEAALLDEYKNKLLKADNDLELCQTNIYRLGYRVNLQQNQIKEELIYKANIIANYQHQLDTLNSRLNEKDEFIKSFNVDTQSITEQEIIIATKVEKSQTQQLMKDEDNQLCQSQNDNLNATSCIPFGDSNVHQLNISGIGCFDVLCDSQLAGPGWIVIQQRVGGNDSFDWNWATYREGFGSMDSDFFLGLEKIHRITSLQRFELYIHLVDNDGSIYFAHYDDFKISDEDNGYALSLGSFNGTAEEDAMSNGENMKFSTFDRDHDIVDSNCAVEYRSGWWYKDCYNCNLNAPYGPNLNWWVKNKIELIEAKMLIRPAVEEVSI
ncbi:ficolin-1-like [Drosophila nasuta]|uniref:ficolin-1-like n=1 Tax=Drosophila nasuta TaxID=42062 RepID=UPI00295F4831|nr:ficolin-1-like [Drosophila nasuta]